MSSNSFGKIFTITTAGESHGKANVVIVDGCPPNLPLNEDDIQVELDRRRPGQSSLTTQRDEKDKVLIASGVFEGKTTGTPIALIVNNEDQRSRDYEDIKNKYRPGHADFSFEQKYGVRDYRGGGRSSARETVSRVAAGAIAKKILNLHHITCMAYTKSIGHLVAEVDYKELSFEKIDSNPVRCPDKSIAEEMSEFIKKIRSEKDSIGGMSEVFIRGVVAGLGEPVFDKLKADFAKAFLSLPAVLSFEYGLGRKVSLMKGSENNDLFVNKNGITTKTNNHGGILGGISTGQDIVLQAAVKPTSSLPQEQETVDSSGCPTSILTKGRHDPCLLPRFIPIAEAMANLVLVDHLLRWRAQCPQRYLEYYKGNAYV